MASSGQGTQGHSQRGDYPLDAAQVGALWVASSRSCFIGYVCGLAAARERNSRHPSRGNHTVGRLLYPSGAAAYLRTRAS